MQPKLFDVQNDTADIRDIILYALGDFQSRGKVLAGRELAYDRLRGAFLRAFSKFGIAEPPDEAVVEALQTMGAHVVKVPKFVAKHPFRITISREIAANAASSYINDKSV